MPEVPFTAADPSSSLKALAELLRVEIPLSGQMERRRSTGFDDAGLTVCRCRSGRTGNPHQTAFAGSLNALCTIAGWGMTHLLLEQLGRRGSTVIRRSSIKYHEPIQTDRVVAICLAPSEADLAYFAEMLDAKGQAKLDHVVHSLGPRPDQPAMLFSGSYVTVLDR